MKFKSLELGKLVRIIGHTTQTFRLAHLSQIENSNNVQLTQKTKTKLRSTPASLQHCEKHAIRAQAVVKDTSFATACHEKV
jgi:hypothetical protein